MTTWAAFKSLMIAKGLSPQYTEDADKYSLKLFEGPMFLADCLIYKSLNLEDSEDFETNYKSTANQSVLNQFDTDGAQIIRVKAARRGWSYWAIPIELTTSMIDGNQFAEDSEGNSFDWITTKIYDDSNVEITTAGDLDVNLAGCVKTVLDFEPPFNYELIGGTLRINSNPVTDVRLWIVGAPDIPAIYGGSKEFASGVNLKFLSADNSLDVDGRVTKSFTYNPDLHSGKIRFIIKHPPGTVVNFLITVEIYRQ